MSRDGRRDVNIQVPVQAAASTAVQAAAQALDSALDSPKNSALDSPKNSGVRIQLRPQTADECVVVGAVLGSRLRAGDVVVLDGPLGAGKTTLTRGIAAGLGVRGPVSSPTFVIARRHPSVSGGPDLVHVDAYRLGSALELDELDLDADVAECVTVVEWGMGRAERLAESWLLVRIGREIGAGSPVDVDSNPEANGRDGSIGVDSESTSPRSILIEGYGPDWPPRRVEQLLYRYRIGNGR